MEKNGFSKIPFPFQFHYSGLGWIYDLRIHNTLTGNKEDFFPLKRKSGMYVCGVTVYDLATLACPLGDRLRYDLSLFSISWISGNLRSELYGYRR
jgi:hypothetical protein